MTRIARLLAVLLISVGVISLGRITTGVAAIHPADVEPAILPAAEAASDPSVTCLSFGLYGEITAEALVASLSEGGEDLIFVGTTNGLYVVGLDGKLRHFLYSPFGIRHFALMDDVTGDGVREIVVVLADTQVPALRCYDGATWEKLWQVAPVSTVWDREWVKRQMSITTLEVIEARGSQSIVITSGRCVFSVDATDGKVNWRYLASGDVTQMTTISDTNGDGVDEVFAGSEDGHLFLLNGKTGRMRWQEKLPQITVNRETTTQAKAAHVLTLDREAGLVAAASTDGSVRLFDMKGRRLEWEISLPTQSGVSPGPIALVQNATPDGRPGVLISYAGSGMIGPQLTLLDASGSKLWETYTRASSLDLGSYDGKRVIIVPAPPQWIKLIDLADGASEVKNITVSTPDDLGNDVRQIEDDAFLLVSSLTAVSSSGDVLWHYPKIANVKALSGNFVGNAAEDTLFSAEWKSTVQFRYGPGGIAITTTGSAYASQANEPEVRLLKMMDGPTGEIAWSYEVPLGELSNGGGLKGIQVTPDLVGSDNMQDIIGYRGDTVFIFSGKDGSSFSFPVGQPVASLEVIRNGAGGYAIAVGAADGLTIFDSSGTELWRTTGEEWVDDATADFTVLDDLNSDNVSDLAVLSANKIVLLVSLGSATAYQPHLTFNAEADSVIEYAEVVPDSNGDGVRELVYIQRNPGSQQAGQSTTPGCPLLIKRSPVDGRELLSVTMPGRYPDINLACGDFNGDGCADSLICYNSYDTCESTPSGPQTYVQNPGMELLIVSGRDGTTIRTHHVNQQHTYSSGWHTLPPAANIGDVTGDGKDDLAWTFVDGFQSDSGYYAHQQRIEVYDVARDQSLLVSATPVLRENGYTFGVSTAVLPADVDADGRSEILADIHEPSMASYETVRFGGVISTGSATCLAIVDTDSGRRLAGFMGFNTATMSLFDAHQSGTLGVAAAGGAYFLDTGDPLQVTSPAGGAKTGPVVPVRLEGTSEGSFVQVFVDGMRYHAGNDSRIDLYLAHGQHDIVVRSVDDYGRILYGPSDLSAPLAIKVTPSPWKPVLLVLSVLALVVIALLLSYARLHRVWRARQRVARR